MTSSLWCPATDLCCTPVPTGMITSQKIIVKLRHSYTCLYGGSFLCAPSEHLSTSVPHILVHECQPQLYLHNTSTQHARGGTERNGRDYLQCVECTSRDHRVSRSRKHTHSRPSKFRSFSFFCQSTKSSTLFRQLATN